MHCVLLLSIGFTCVPFPVFPGICVQLSVIHLVECYTRVSLVFPWFYATHWICLFLFCIWIRYLFFLTRHVTPNMYIVSHGHKLNLIYILRYKLGPQLCLGIIIFNILFALGVNICPHTSTHTCTYRCAKAYAKHFISMFGSKHTALDNFRYATKHFCFIYCLLYWLYRAFLFKQLSAATLFNSQFGGVENK